MRNRFLSLAVLSFLSVTFLACQQRKIKAKEAVLRQDLKVMRNQIDNYTIDLEKAPQALQDLVEAGYLRRIPEDPFTGSAQTWQVETARRTQDHQTNVGISNVRSGSKLLGSDGTPYSSW